MAWRAAGSWGARDVKLYDAAGPNPHVVRMFLAEKGLDIPSTVLVLGTGDGRSPAHLARNPLGQAPVLETDAGQFISEIVAICEYIEEIQPEPTLIGRTPEERAETRMWARRVDLNICEPLVNGFRFGPAGLLGHRARFPGAFEASAASRRVAHANLAWLNGQMSGQDYLCGQRFSFADITLFAFVNHGIQVGQLLEPDWTALTAWFERVRSRPSATEWKESRTAELALGGTV